MIAYRNIKDKHNLTEVHSWTLMNVATRISRGSISGYATAPLRGKPETPLDTEFRDGVLIYKI